MKKQHRRNFKTLGAKAEPSIPSWLQVRNEATHTDMVISGSIGKSWWDDSGTSSKEFRDELKKIPQGRKISVRINSEGGSIQDGLEIYNTLKERRADVTCYVDGYAVSIASIIALAGHKTISPKSSIWMIHEPWSMTQGSAEDHIRSAEMLDKHGEMLAAIYAEETGRGKTEMRQAMKKETWFTGEEATDYGLADESPDELPQAAFAALDVSKFNNIPQPILNQILAAAATGTPSQKSPPAIVPPVPAASLSQANAGAGKKQEPTPPRQQTPQIIMNKTQMLAWLKKRDITPPADATDEQLLALIENYTPQAAAPNPGEPTLAEIQAQLTAERTVRITNEVNAHVDACRIPKDSAKSWIARAMKDETVLVDLAALPANTPGGEPLAGRVVILNENPLEKIRNEHKTPMARANAMRADWDGLFKDAVARDSRRGLAPMNSNTYSGTLVTSFLMDGSLTPLQNMWAMMSAFSKDYSPDPYKPLSTGVLKNPTAGSATLTDATNFEQGNSTVAPISVTMHQYTQPFQVSNSDLNSGLRMQDLVTINAANFANKVIEVATAPITAANFTTGQLVSAPAAFGFSDMATLYGQLKKSPIKNIILDGEYLARIVNTPGFFQPTGTEAGNAWQRFGWDLVALNTDWTGAGSNVRGFACNPQAIVGITGLPLTPPNIPGGNLTTQTMVIPGPNISIAVYTWFALASRTMWCSYDVMAGFALGDVTAGNIITSQ